MIDLYLMSLPYLYKVQSFCWFLLPRIGSVLTCTLWMKESNHFMEICNYFSKVQLYHELKPRIFQQKCKMFFWNIEKIFILLLFNYLNITTPTSRSWNTFFIHWFKTSTESALCCESLKVFQVFQVLKVFKVLEVFKVL